MISDIGRFKDQKPQGGWFKDQGSRPQGGTYQHINTPVIQDWLNGPNLYYGFFLDF